MVSENRFSRVKGLMPNVNSRRVRFRTAQTHDGAARPQRRGPGYQRVDETDAALSLDAALEEVLAAPAEEVESTVSTAPVAEEESGAKKAVNDFIDRQKRLLVGKTLQKDLVNADGGVILNAGDTVSDDIIDFLRRIDRKFLIRLAECVV